MASFRESKNDEFKLRIWSMKSKEEDGGNSAYQEDWRWCPECDFIFPDACGKHGGLRKVEDKSLPVKAFYTLPDGLSIRAVTQSGNRGVYTNTTLEARTIFGPVEGPFIPKARKRIKQNLFEVKVEDNENYVSLDLQDEELCNWMMFIRPASSPDHQNMVAVLKENKVYYVTLKDIPANEELRVWYSVDYACILDKHATAVECELEVPASVYYSSVPHIVVHDTDGKENDSVSKDSSFPGDDLHDNCEVHFEVFSEEPPDKDVDENQDGDVDDAHDDLSDYEYTSSSKAKKPTTRRSKRQKKPKTENVSFTGKTQPQKTKRKETKPRYICDTCNEGFKRYDVYKIHVASHDGTLPFICDFEGCKKGFKNKFLYLRHQSIHQDNSVAIRCPYCVKTFRRRDHFKKHLVIHDQNRDVWKCGQCNKSYIREESFKFHQAVHHADEAVDQHDCLICGLELSSREEHRSHLRATHNKYKSITGKVRTIKCPECDKMFLCSKEVKRHMVVHTKRKDFLCEYCPQVFGRKDHLSRHYKCAHPDGAQLKSKTKKSERRIPKSQLNDKKKTFTDVSQPADTDLDKPVFRSHQDFSVQQPIPQIHHHHDVNQGRFVPPSYEDVTRCPPYTQATSSVRRAENDNYHGFSVINRVANCTPSSSLSMSVVNSSQQNPSFHNAQFPGTSLRPFDTDHSYMISPAKYSVDQTLATSSQKPDIVWNSEELKKREYETVGYLQSFALGANPPIPWDQPVNVDMVPVLQQISASAVNESANNNNNNNSNNIS